MKNKVLILRTAQFSVIDTLNNFLNKEFKNLEVYFIVQKQFYDIAKVRYPNFNIVTCNDGFLNYANYLSNTELRTYIENINFDLIIIPSSLKTIDDFYEAELICTKIKKKKLIFYNCYGEIFEKKNSFLYLIFSKKLQYLYQNYISYIGLRIIFICSFVIGCFRNIGCDKK
jgi:hypothetical protein